MACCGLALTHAPALWLTLALMGAEDAKGGLNGDTLSSWKEIAAHLKCGVRTCIRWEKERNLPIHRMAEAPGSRVYAYRSELDAWLARELSVKGGRRALNSDPRLRRRRALLVLSLAVAAVFLFILFRSRPGPEPFHTGRFAVITSEVGGPGRLRTWEPDREGDYRSIWSIVSGPKNTVRHSTIAAGDIDGDGRTELAAPTYAKRIFHRAETDYTDYVIFINFYKDGQPGLWKTTFFSEADHVPEENDYRLNEITLWNLDGDAQTEVILKTASHLTVFDYRTDVKEFKKIASVQVAPEGRPVLLRSVTVARLGPAGPSTIIVTADEVPSSANAVLSPGGWLIFADLVDGVLKVPSFFHIDASFCDAGLRAGDVNRDGLPEIFATAARLVDGRIDVVLLGWDTQVRKITDIVLPGAQADGPRSAVLAVHDVTFEAGADVIVGLRPNRVLLYEWGKAGLELRSQHTLDAPGAMINAVGSSDTDSDHFEEVVVAGGSSPAAEGSGHFLLEFLGYNSVTGEFLKKWGRIGGAADEAPVNALAIARK